MSSVAAWEHFLESGTIATVGDAGVRGVIAESWLRSHELGIAAENLGIPRVDVDADSPFVTAAAPVLLSMADLLVGSSTSLALTDDTGTVTWRWDSEPGLTKLLDATEVQPGASMGESGSGTNGIAVAAALRRPATVVGAEHYKQAWHLWACAAAPVFHPITRQLIGLVNVACRAEDANHLLHVAVRSMVREIQMALWSNATLPEQKLLNAHLKRRSLTRNPVITVDSRTLIAGDDGLGVALNHEGVWGAVAAAGPLDTMISLRPGLTARVHRIQPGRPESGATLEVLRGTQLNEHVSPTGQQAQYSSPSGLTELELAEYRVIRDALQRHRGNKLAAAEELRISRGTLYSRIRRYRLDQASTR